MDPNENENPPVEESASYQTIYINYDDLQNSMGSNNLYNSLLPQIKLPVSVKSIYLYNYEHGVKNASS